MGEAKGGMFVCRWGIVATVGVYVCVCVWDGWMDGWVGWGGDAR